MDLDAALLVTCLALALLIALPGLWAVGRRRGSRDASEVAAALAEFAAVVRREGKCLAPDPALLARVEGMGVPEAVSFHFARQLASPDPVLLADAAQRLALRLKRRVAFERKMLARTAPGLRRGAIAASLPPVLLWLLAWFGAEVPASAQINLFVAEAVGCALLWRLARVEI